jgi:hypothetical protein
MAEIKTRLFIEKYGSDEFIFKIVDKYPSTKFHPMEVKKQQKSTKGNFVRNQSG